MIKLSIIIPYYNCKKYLDELLDCLAPQITDAVEVIIVDDGSDQKYKTAYEWAKVYRKCNGGAGSARNKGIEASNGEYISFIDADDLVAPDYVAKIFEKVENGFDVLEFSWRSLTRDGAQFDYRLKSENDRLSNPSACTRVFSRAYIGDIRFSEIKDAAEDEDFSRRCGYLINNDYKRAVITDYLYFYRTSTENSNTKRFKQGYYNTKRVVYYYDHVTSDMTWLIDQIRKDDEHNEVWLLTCQNDLPELARWCQISKPFRLWTHYLKGDPYHDCEVITLVPRTQVVLYVKHLHVIGGIESFILNFAHFMTKYYDIVLMSDDISAELYKRISAMVPIAKTKNKIICDTLIMVRILDTVPTNVEYNQLISMCHACKTNPQWHMNPDADIRVNVSQASTESFEEEAEDSVVIHNLIRKDERKALILVSATRYPAPDKGKNGERMMQLAKMLNDADIPFLWFNFSEGQIRNAPKGFYNMGLCYDIQPYIARADYLIQLSDSEAYSYSILEALINNTAVIVTPIPSAVEQGVVDGENGYIVPFDMDFDVHELLQVPEFNYTYDNERIIKQWRKLLGNKKPLHKYNPGEHVTVCVNKLYTDIALNQTLHPGEMVQMTLDRATYLQNMQFVNIINTIS